MRKIVLQSLVITNFKGIRHLEVSFQENETTVCGENGTGKTTIMDAFLWLLFGKDSTGRSDSNFNIKTLGEDGKPILKQEHSVCGTLSVDGKAIKLQRDYVEVWSRPTGLAEETLSNHKTVYYINDVKQSTKRDYDAEINTIIPEDVFRMLTDPGYFCRQNASVQKDMLLDMAGTVTDEEVAALKPEYLELLASLQGRPLATFLKELAARKRAINDELRVIPASIATAERLKPEESDWKALEKELTSKRSEVEKLNAQIADKTKLNDAESERKLGIQRRIGDRKLELQRRHNAIRQEAEAGRSEAQRAVQDLEYKIRGRQRELEMAKNAVAGYQSQVRFIEQTLAGMRVEYRRINEERLQFPEGAFVCPTCGRPLEQEDIDAKRIELEANFNTAKAKRLQENKERGIREKQNLEARQESLHKAESELADRESELEGMRAELEMARTSVPQAPDTYALIAADAECKRLTNEITELENQLTVAVKVADVSELTDRRNAVSAEIEGLVKRLSERDAIKRAEEEIRSLEDRRVAANQALTELEGMEYVATDFQKAKDAALLERINGMFKVVSFSFVDSQLNGGEKLTCVCTVNGTPYPDVNNAGKVNAGIDIINAICKSKGICAPIFIDNRESVCELIPTQSQIINLVVAEGKPLSVLENGNYVNL